MKTTLSLFRFCGAALFMLCAAPALAASIFMTPAGGASAERPAVVSVAPAASGLLAFDLFMDFDAAEPTVGGGIDLALSAPLSFVEFAPSAYFLTAMDGAFSGHGTAFADNDYEIHFGNFAGVSGLNALGVVTVSLDQPLGSFAGQTASIELSINSAFGGFASATSPGLIDVALSGAVISAVPEASSALMLLAGLGVVGAVVRRRHAASKR